MAKHNWSFKTSLIAGSLVNILLLSVISNYYAAKGNALGIVKK